MTSPNTIIADLTAEVESLRKQQWIIAHGSAELAIEKCKNATGQRRTIDMYVSPNQCANDVLEAIANTKVDEK